MDEMYGQYTQRQKDQEKKKQKQHHRIALLCSRRSQRSLRKSETSANSECFTILSINSAQRYCTNVDKILVVGSS